MRSHQLALLGAAALASSASADTEPQTFVPTTLSGPFLEQFNDSWEKRWVASSATKAAPVGASGETFTYVGVWSVEEPTVFPGIPGDKGLVVKSKAAHHAISAEIQPAVKIEEGKPLVVQYETKLQKGLECGGAYVKLLSEGEGDLSANEFSDKTPFTIMFGPDKCGSTNKVHFIFRHLNPKTGVYEEKHLSATPSPMITKTTALYTLIVNPDNTYEILINDESAKKGSLLEDFTPAVNPPAEIDDASDFKPADWVDEAFIVDPEAVKPEDWDESAPRTVVDTEATMPDGWLEDEPDVIPDPDAEKPEEWDDEEDGDWIAPVVSNPKCEDAPGCGPWSQPSIPNPAYKGIWSAPKITNPAYLGVWAPRKIPNPDFFEDKDVAKGLTAIGGVGFEIWTMTEDVLFDNVYVGHSVEDAKKLAEETFHVKNKLEREAEKVALGADEEDEDAATKPFYEEYLKIAKERVPLFVELVKENPIEAIKAMPEVAGGLVAALLLPLTLAFALLTFLSAPAAAAAATTPKKTAPATTTTTAKKLVVPAPETDETIAGADKADVDSGLRERKGKGREL